MDKLVGTNVARRVHAPDGLEPIPAPAIGKIAQARMAAKARDDEVAEIARELQDKRERLWELERHPPPPPTDYRDVATSVDIDNEYAVEVAHLRAEVAKLQRILQERQIEARSFHMDGASLAQKAQKLQSDLSGLRRAAKEAMNREAQEEIDAAQRKKIHKRDVATRKLAVADAERQLRELLGS